MIMRLELEKGGRAEAGEAEGRGRVITNHRESLAILNPANALHSRINIEMVLMRIVHCLSIL